MKTNTMNKTKNSALKSLAVAGFIGVCSVGVSQGAVMVSDIGGGNYHADIDFSVTVTNMSSVGHIITVEDFYASVSPNGGGVPSNGSVTISVNGGAVQPVNLTTNSGIYPQGYGFWDGNDFAMSWSGTPSYGLGDVLTFSGEFDFSHVNPLDFAAASGLGVTLSSNDSLNSISLGSGTTDATVPEPSSTALLGLGGLALMLRRRR